MEDPYYDEDEARHERRHIRTVLLLAIAVILGGIGLAAVLNKAHAEAIYRGENAGVVLTLYSEDCKLKDQITNLSKRITWEEKGSTYEGCFAIHQSGFVVVF